MLITVNEALELDDFKTFKVVAGRNGLENKVLKVGILDWETLEVIEESFEVGEFIISTLLIIKDNADAMYEIVETLIGAKCSGFAVKNIYFNEIPQDVIKLANDHDFPIMIFSDSYFENIITTVLEAIRDKKDSSALALKVDNILYSNLNHVMIKRIAYEINRNFKETNVSVFCQLKEWNGNEPLGIQSGINENGLHNGLSRVIPYNDGYLIINTFDDIDPKNLRERLNVRLEMLGFDLKQYRVGVGSIYDKLDELDLSIKESIYAFNHAKKYTREISYFDSLGTNKILMPLIDNPWIQKYYDEMIAPLVIYDKKNDTELMKTATRYIENNGEIKATAVDLVQHDNTIRYRIEKINKILSADREIEHFFEELAMAIRIHNLIK